MGPNIRGSADGRLHEVGLDSLAEGSPDRIHLPAEIADAQVDIQGCEAAPHDTGNAARSSNVPTEVPATIHPPGCWRRDGGAAATYRRHSGDVSTMGVRPEVVNVWMANERALPVDHHITEEL